MEMKEIGGSKHATMNKQHTDGALPGAFRRTYNMDYGGPQNPTAGRPYFCSQTKAGIGKAASVQATNVLNCLGEALCFLVERDEMKGATTCDRKALNTTALISERLFSIQQSSQFCKLFYLSLILL
jgi:hypothetical protein